MRCVVVESPYRGNIEANADYARRCLYDCLTRGEAPIASHLLYTQILDDEKKEERLLSILAGHAWIPLAAALVVYIDRGISEGMQYAIDLAKELGVGVEFRSLRPQESIARQTIDLARELGVGVEFGSLRPKTRGN